MIKIDGKNVNVFSYRHNGRLWISDDNYVPSDYDANVWGEPGHLNAVYYKGVLVWGDPRFATTELEHFSFGSIGDGNTVYIRRPIEDYPSTGQGVKVSYNGFPMYVVPSPYMEEDITPQNMEYPRSISYDLYVWSEINSFLINANSSNMFRNVYSRKVYNGNDGFIEQLNFCRVTDSSSMFESCRYLGFTAVPNPQTNNLTTANNLIMRWATNVGAYTENASKTFYECSYLRGNVKVPINCKNLSATFYNCGNVTGNLETGPSVEDASYAFFNCVNLRGDYSIGGSVKNLDYTFYRTFGTNNLYVSLDTRLIGSIPNNVETMRHTFRDSYCGNTAVCGPKVSDISYAYANTTVFTIDGSWDNVKHLDYTFADIGPEPRDMFGDLWLNYLQNNSQDEQVSATRMLEGRSHNSQTPRFNIHVRPLSFWNSWFYTHANDIVGNTITWTLNQGGEFFYNTEYNLYVYYAETYQPGGVDLQKFSVEHNTGYNNMYTVYVNKIVDADVPLDN